MAGEYSRFGKISALANILPHMGDVKEMGIFIGYKQIAF
jgi:hypothetical protein